MKKALVVAAVLIGLGVLARRFGPKMSSIDWEKTFERMPDNAPPKWMFRNITAIRENTERILELLESRHAGPAPASVAATGGLAPPQDGPQDGPRPPARTRRGSSGKAT